MPRSTTPAEGMAARNRERLKGMLRQLIEAEKDSIQSQLMRYEVAAKGITHPAVSGELEHLRHMLTALNRLQLRLSPSIKRHVPQEERD